MPPSDFVAIDESAQRRDVIWPSAAAAPDHCCAEGQPLPRMSGKGGRVEIVAQGQRRSLVALPVRRIEFVFRIALPVGRDRQERVGIAADPALGRFR